MTDRLRASAAVRAFAVAGGIVAVLGSFGLHPEPFGADSPAAHSGMASAHADEAPHACPACRSHAAGLVVPAGSAPADERVPDRIVRLAASAPAGRLAARELSGRSPPVRS